MSTQREVSERIVRKAELLEITGVSIATVYRWIGDGHFPAPVKLGPNCVGWRSSDVDAWLERLKPAGPSPADTERQSPVRQDGSCP